MAAAVDRARPDRRPQRRLTRVRPAAAVRSRDSISVWPRGSLTGRWVRRRRRSLRDWRDREGGGG
jgi:hypothetical protein